MSSSTVYIALLRFSESLFKGLHDLLGGVLSDSDRRYYRRYYKKLSGGEQQRVAIARAISTGADIIITDEPTSNLGKATALDIVGLFDDLAYKEGKCVIVATHSDYFHSFADCIVTLDNMMLKAV